MSNTEYTIGIDFGTCFSFPASVIDDDPESLLQNGGSVGIPTCFYSDRKNGFKYGSSAQSHGWVKPEWYVRNVKSDIFEYGLDKSYTLDGKQFSIVEVCALILRHIIDGAETEIRKSEGNITFKKAVISIPVTFKEVQKSVLISAAKIPRSDGGPGLEKIGFIQEPVAAALYYARKRKVKSESILVYDLGGGTFDVALVYPTPGSISPYKVKDYDGTRIGGNDFDNVIVECDEYCNKAWYELQKQYIIKDS